MSEQHNEQDLFMPEDAERFFKASAGKPYQPSNGTEGEMFMSMWCARCVHDAAFRADPDQGAACPIAAASMAYDRNDPAYPPEWKYGPRGQPICAAFAADSQP